MLTHIIVSLRPWSWALLDMILWDASGTSHSHSSRELMTRRRFQKWVIEVWPSTKQPGRSETSTGYHAWIAIFNLLGPMNYNFDHWVTINRKTPKIPTLRQDLRSAPFLLVQDGLRFSLPRNSWVRSDGCDQVGGKMSLI